MAEIDRERLSRISGDRIRELVKPFTDDYGRTYSLSRYRRVAQAQLEEDQKVLSRVKLLIKKQQEV